jgi:hypothetical protein
MRYHRLGEPGQVPMEPWAKAGGLFVKLCWSAAAAKGALRGPLLTAAEAERVLSLPTSSLAGVEAYHGLAGSQ